jgi:hypothetical protein
MRFLLVYNQQYHYEACWDDHVCLTFETFDARMMSPETVSCYNLI